VDYQLECNEDGRNNSLHSGPDGYEFRMWEAEPRESTDSIAFFLTSPDGDQGFPGEFKVTVTYSLTEENMVKIHYEGITDATTIVNMTNHSYFNLNGHDAGTILDHTLMIDADGYVPIDEYAIPYGIVSAVEGTPFDFRQFHAIGERIDEDHEQLKLGAGYDHWYPIKGEGMRLDALMRGKKLELIVESDFPGVHIYTSNWFTGWQGKNNHFYTKRSSAALEASYLPNAVNYETAVKPICRANETLRHEIRFRLRNISQEAL
jgi:aldose 1-epimerase